MERLVQCLGTLLCSRPQHQCEGQLLMPATHWKTLIEFENFKDQCLTASTITEFFNFCLKTKTKDLQ